LKPEQLEAPAAEEEGNHRQHENRWIFASNPKLTSPEVHNHAPHGRRKQCRQH